MSLIFPYRPYNEVGDFYDSIQGIHDGFECNEDFGKYVSPKVYPQDLKKVYSYKDLKAIMAYEEGVRKSFSTSSFQGVESESPPGYYGKVPFGYELEDHSTMGSFSSATSLNSHVSIPSSTNCSNAGQKTCNGAKNKFKSKKKANGEVNYRQKYKTEACKYWAEKGYCEFGDQCAFAHGNVEMRQKSHISSNYKTKKCNQFHETGYCPYGVRCQFIHSLRKDCQSNPAFDNASYSEALETAEIWWTHDPDCLCMQKKTRCRLPSFQMYSTDENGSGDEMKPKDSKESEGEKNLENVFETFE